MKKEKIYDIGSEKKKLQTSILLKKNHSIFTL